MKTYSAALVAAFVALTSATACGRTPLPPSPLPGENSTLTLTGRVLDATMADDSGVADALVEVSRDSFSMSTTTGPDGTFVLGGLEAGQYMLSVSREGYLETAQSVLLDADQEVTCLLDREAGDENATPARKGRIVIVKKGAQARR